MKNNSYLIIITEVLMLMSCNKPIKDDGKGNGLVGQSPLEFKLIEKKSIKNNTEKKQLTTINIPPQNLSKGITPPIPDVDTDERAKEIINYISGQQSNPLASFIPLKYYLLLHPKHDKYLLQTLHTKRKNSFLKTITKLKKSKKYNDSIYLSFVVFNCNYLTEDKIGRYECKARIEFETNGERKQLTIKRVLNWGTQWYILEMR